MSIIQQDPAHPEREVSFELESPGGYRRTVNGTIAYLDEEAHTYMIRAPDRALIRVPMRDIKRTVEGVA